MKRLVISGVMALMLALIPASGALAATTQDVTVTATPSFVSIANDPATWTINGISGSGKIAPSTTYYSNPLGDTTAPSATVVDGECRFTVTNTSTVATNIVVNFPNHTGGNASTNGAGTAGANAFAAFGYVSGQLLTAKVTLQAAGSANLISALAATTNFKWGMQYSSQTGAWTSGTSMTSTVTMTATAS